MLASYAVSSGPLDDAIMAQPCRGWRSLRCFKVLDFPIGDSGPMARPNARRWVRGSC
ncbi:hypothetical protein HDV57DRAFT_341466 [Trichoderma longibrachiatum]|uniref:Uncharacterized protein n=1 Tax=Trichoderma longibrachiatum ATCC 18648 TaxID=983965 RepID=A0A2T4BY77_TRILO|nr:hypothetical protein M440DRAFT_1043809 [Trichoderma longibrachiatum ATCC 18648]